MVSADWTRRFPKSPKKCQDRPARKDRRLKRKIRCRHISESFPHARTPGPKPASQVSFAPTNTRARAGSSAGRQGAGLALYDLFRFLRRALGPLTGGVVARL